MGLRQRGSRAAAAILSVGLLLLGAPSATSRAAEPDAASVTTIEAAASSAIDFRLSRATSFDVSAGPDSSLTVEGRGRAVAAILRRVGASKAVDGFTVARFNGCGAPGCAAPADEPSHVYARSADGQKRDAGGRALLEPGRYRLWLLSDGAPVKATLRLPGQLRAETSWQTTEFVASGLSAGSETAAVPLSPSYWSGGTSLNLPTEDAVLLGFLQQDSPLGTVVGAAGACHFSGPPPLLGHYAPGCPFTPGSSGNAQVGSLSTEQLTLGSAERARMATFLPAVQGDQQAGFWSARAGLTDTPLTLFVWMALD